MERTRVYLVDSVVHPITGQILASRGSECTVCDREAWAELGIEWIMLKVVKYTQSGQIEYTVRHRL